MSTAPDKKQVSSFTVKGLIIYLLENYRLFHISSIQVVLAIVTPLLLGAVLILGWMYARKVKEIVTNDFNHQQLVLAQHAARQIENNLNTLKKELTLLGLSPSLQYFEKISLGKRMDITFSSVRDHGVREVRFIESSHQQVDLSLRFIDSIDTRTHLVDSEGYRTADTEPEDIMYMKWAGHVKNRGTILLGEIKQLPGKRPQNKGAIRDLLTIKMAIPVWQVSVDEANPVATNKLSGVLLFVIDATSLIEKVTNGISSGKTGYAWVINENGLFLYHPENDFIGKNAFEARKEKRPTISFTRINEIQKDLMLAGKEGTSWYISGWHRGEEGEIKKLIAYSPIHLSEPDNRLWSVAVVAPISEVEDSIKSIHIRQFSLQTLIIVVILLGGITVVSLMFTWSHALEQEVNKKTLELKKSEDQYRLLIENANDIIFTVNREGELLSINQAGCLFFNSTKEELIGRNIGDICYNEDSASLQYRAIDHVFRTGESRQIVYIVNINNNEHWLSTNFSGLLDEHGNVFAVLGISRNITQRKRMEEQMLHTEKLASMGTLAAGVAHEINNPLAIILGFTDLMLEKAPESSELYEQLKTIEKQGINAKRVVENLLSFARYTEHKEENVDINKNLETVLAVIGNSISINKITIIRKMADSLPLVKGDNGELQQVFFNIINNAIYFMKGGGRLTIVTREVGNEQNVEIKISDTGCGIRKENRTRIFDPLFTTKKVGEGTGLGLSVSYGIISKHGGNITFETKTPDESNEPGTTFIITFPAIKQ